jgi:hypothetical protein
MSLHANLATVVDDWARFERATERSRMAIAEQHYPHQIKPCEACGKARVVQDGVCPSCLDVLAGACRIAAKSFKK